jgi:RHS repeat-associated protein
VLTEQVVGQDGGTTSNTYDQAGNLIKSVDPDGNYTLYTYDANDNVLTEQRYNNGGGLVGSTTNTYDEAGNLVKSVDGDNNYALHTYDGAGNQLTAKSYDAAGHLISSTTNTYDEAANVIKSVDGDGNYTLSTYDAAGNVLTENAYNAGGAQVSSTTNTYDEDGNLIQTLNGDGNVTLATFDGAGNMTSQTLGAGTSAAATTHYTYDEAGNLIKLVDPTGNTTVWTYDANGQKRSMTDAAGNTATWQYDGAGRLTTYTDRDGRKQTYQYDANGNLTQEQWFNNSGSLVDTLSFTYDQDGNLLTASNANGAYTFTYTGAGLVASMQEPGGLSLTYGYDLAGNRTSVVDSLGGNFTLTYDGSQLSGKNLTDSAGDTLGVYLTYDQAGNLTKIVRYGQSVSPAPSPATTNIGYNESGNITNITQTNPSGTTIASFAYTFDLAGRLTSETDNGSTTNYAYDPTGQLIQAGSQTYNFDASGNPSGAGVQLGPDNELLSNGTFAFTYDAEGNEITRTNIATGDKWTFGYNNANELVSAIETTSAGTVETQVAYKYDVFGNLLERDVTIGGATTTTRFGLDWTGGGSPTVGASTSDVAWNVWALLSGSGSLTTRFLHGEAVDQVFAEIGTGSAIGWDLTDHLGSTRDVVDNNGNVLDAINYDAFGNITSQSNASQAPLFVYTGRQRDSATGLQYNRARWYDPTSQRWISQDPLSFGAGDTNLYRYVQNGPTNAVDPSGNMLVASDGFTAHEYYDWLRTSYGIRNIRYANAGDRYVFYATGVPDEGRNAHDQQVLDALRGRGNAQVTWRWDENGAESDSSGRRYSFSVGEASGWHVFGGNRITSEERSLYRELGNLDAVVGQGISPVGNVTDRLRANRALAAQQAFERLNDPSWGTIQRRERIGLDRWGEPIYGTYAEKTAARIAEERRLMDIYNRHIADEQAAWEQRRAQSYDPNSLAGMDQQIGSYPRQLATSSDPTDFRLRNARTFGDWVAYGFRQALRGLQVAASVGEIVIGITSASTGIGVAVTIHGLDGLQSGLRSILTDENVNTLTSEAVAGVGRAIDLEDQARMVAHLADLSISVLAVGPSNVLRSLGSGNIMAGGINVPVHLAGARVGMEVNQLTAAGTRLLAERGAPARLGTNSLEASRQTSCFVAGTPLLTPEGDKRIEQFRPGDRIVSRPERNCEAPVEVKLVEEVFERVAPVLQLEVGGRTIRTTAEHPFFVRGKGWQCAEELKPRDELSSHDGQWVTVEAVTDLTEVATVYNLRVSDYHTYFVGSREWGFSVWAHNINCADVWRALGRTGEIPEASRQVLSDVVAAINSGNRTEAARLLRTIGGVSEEVAGNLSSRLHLQEIFSHVQIPVSQAFTEGTIPQILDRLPLWIEGQQKRVFGILVIDGRAYYLRSGLASQTQVVGGRTFSAGVLGNSPKAAAFDRLFPDAAAHVEACAAAIMQNTNARNATLYLNLHPCSTTASNCWSNLQHWIPQGSQIRVVSQSAGNITGGFQSSNVFSRIINASTP